MGMETHDDGRNRNLFLLGSGANFLLYCLLKGFALVDASILAPFRYVELMFSALLGFLVFAEIPAASTVIGAIVIIPSTLYVVYFEAKKKGRKDADKEEGAVLEEAPL